MAAKKKSKTTNQNKKNFNAKDVISFIMVPISLYMMFSMFTPGKTGFLGEFIRNYAVLRRTARYMRPSAKAMPRQPRSPYPTGNRPESVPAESTAAPL